MGYNAIATAVSNIDVQVSTLEKLLAVGEYYNRQINSLNSTIKYLKEKHDLAGADYDKICFMVRECELSLKNLCIHARNLDSSFPSDLKFPNVKMSFTERVVPGGLKGLQTVLAGASAAGIVILGGLYEATVAAILAADNIVWSNLTISVLTDENGIIGYAKSLKEIKNYAGKMSKDKLDVFFNNLNIELAKLSIKIQGDKQVLENYVAQMKSVCNMMEDPRRRIQNNIVARTSTIDMQDYISKLYRLNKSLSKLENLKIVDFKF